MPMFFQLHVKTLIILGARCETRSFSKLSTWMAYRERTQGMRFAMRKLDVPRVTQVSK